MATSNTATLNEDLQATIRLLARLSREHFYGKVSLSFQNGVIKHITQEQSVKPEELPG